MRSWDVSTLLVLLLAAVAQSQDACLGSTCYPSLGDLMVGRTAQLSATSTCGLYEPQRYCILGYLENEQKCFFCDSRSPYSLSSNPNSHRIENIITTFEPERKMRWWQSENGVHQVSIRLDLETIFQFSHLVLTFKSFRPAAMLVERSKDFGQSWKVFRYFAEDCANSFPGIPEGPAKSVHDVICDSRYSGAEPSTDGEVVLKALDPSFDIDDPYNHDIQELITLTNLRVNFTRLLTLGDTLLGRRRRNPQEKYYYALYEMVVRGSCFCHGHAAQCVPADGIRGDVFSEPGMVHGRCVCQHNTAGDNCERCQDFYNDSPWRPGGVTDSVVCGRCNCHGHSESCHFDMERYLASGEVSGGVCDNCRNNRMGAQCELCQPYFYQDPRRSVDDPEACIPCNCDPAGSLSSGPCDPLTGRCMCKAHVEGERCDRCKYGFYGFSQEDPNGCQVCRCNAQGSVLTPYACDPQTGQCICQSFATGPYCDQCMPGHWGLGSPGQSCVPCDCDPGGAYNSVCSSVDGQCECRNHMVGLSCSEPAQGYFLAPLDFYLYEAENASPLPSGLSSQLIKTTSNPSAHVYPTAPPYVEPLPPPVYPTPYAGQWQPAPPNPFELPKCEHYFRERGYDFTFSNGRFVLVRRERRRARKRRQNQSIPLEPGSDWQIIPRQRVPGVPVTWTGPGFVRVRDGAGLRFIVTNVPASLNYHLVIRYEPESSDDWAAIITVLPRGQPGDGDCPVDPSEKVAALPGSSRAAVLDPPVCLNNGQRYNVDIVFRKQANADPQSSPYILVDSIGLIPKIESLQNFCSESDLAQFQRYNCEGLGAEAGERTLPEVCERLIASMSARIHNGAVPCRCNRIGSLSMSCSKFGGQCDCKPNVIGRCCDSCAPLTYGLGPNGCSPCDCDPSGSTSQLCDQRSGQCSCQSEITGRRCDGCLPGYYGFPRCRPCQCNGLADLCDPQTGVCLDCREHSAGPNCDRCVDGYIGDPLAGESCKPCLCPDVKGSGRFFARSCSRDSDPDKMYCECVEGYTGPHCDKCAPGFYGNLAEPGSRCEECPCNNNIDPTHGGACDPITGECLRCLYNTHGPRCQSCKPGYYGNALAQDCKECSCDRRGTEVLQCPMGGPCFCDPVTGQCPCRTGVVGALCNECDDGYWNFEGASGCQPCNCDPEHSLSNLCNKITGQCPCKPEFGGRQCDECGENYFGNPDIQCISCDCNMEGTLRPACDPSTGECMCRPGVTGFFCHECAPGHEPTFPACAPCHACYHLWTGNVTDVKKAAEKMLTLIPRNMDDLDHNSYLPRIQELMSQLDGLNNLTGRPKDKMDEMEELLKRVNDMMDTLDPNMIIIDQSPLLNTDIDNIRRDFKKLLDNLIEKSKQGPVTDPETLIEALEEIRKYHTEFMKDEKRVEDAKDVVEKSIQTRQNAQRELASCQPRDIKALEKKIKALSIAKLNEEICGAPGNVECSEAKCGGALCGKCGGPSCKGSIPVSKNATQVAENTETDIITFLRNLRDTEIKINDVRQMNEDIKDKAEDMMTKITDSLSKFEKEKNDTKDLLKRVRAFLTDEMVEPEDIEQMANAVLAIKLPASPDKIRDMIKDLQDALKFINNFKEDLKPLEKQVETVKDLEDRAKDILDRTKEIGVPEYIKQLLENAEELQDQAIQSLDQAKKDKDTIADLLTKSEEKLKNAEEGLNSTQPKELLDEIEALKNKTEMNKAQAKEAKAIADEVLTNTTDLNQEFEEVLQEFNKLKNRTQDQSLNEEANKRLKDITKEVETLTKDVEDKMKKIEELEKKIQDSIQEKEGKIQDVADLLKKAEYLKKFISDKVEGYVQCKT